MLEMNRYRVLIPKPKTRAAIIDVGSGVVTNGEIDTEGRIEVWFEGNRYKAENLVTYEQRVMHAAGRLAQRYPTTAKATAPVEEFIEVGTFTFSNDWLTHTLKLSDPATVYMWCGVTHDVHGGRLPLTVLRDTILEMRSAVELSERFHTPVADAELLTAWANQLTTVMLAFGGPL